MDVTADAVLLPSHHQGDLAVGLQAHQSVDHVTAGLFQLFRPDDVVLLIETGLQFYQHGNLFAVLCGLRQRGDDRRIAADPVQGLFDGKHIRILRRLSHKPDHRLKGLVRMMQQDIPFLDLVKNGSLFHELGHGLGFVFFRF